MSDAISLRPGTPEDIAASGRICFEAFRDFNHRHGFPPDFPAVEAATGLMTMLFHSPHVYGVVAEAGGRIVGSNFLWEAEPVMGVGPITVDPAAQARGAGKRLMEAVLERARERNAASVRLVQAAFNTRSMSLYTKLGFDVREPLVNIQGEPIRERNVVPGYTVRAATEKDVDACCDVARRVHGHERRSEVMFGLLQGTAMVVEHAGRITGYASDIGFFGHAVGMGNAEIIALIGAAERFSGPGMLLPSRNGEVFRWCLSRGLRVVQPLTLMSTGLYNEPRGAFLPSILF
jgi:ribosomal protein S18 acetylase RimI-like enzyme